MDMSYADGWRPEEGETLIGEVTDVSVGRSNYGGAYPIITVAPESGGKAVAVHCFHAGLMNRVMELRPEVGERIGFHYKGKQPLKSDPANKTVAVYIVKIEGRGSANVWTQFDAPAPRTDVPVSEEDFRPVQDTTTAPTGGDDDIPF